jgi:hypothetical protein
MVYKTCEELLFRYRSGCRFEIFGASEVRKLAVEQIKAYANGFVEGETENARIVNHTGKL